VDNDLSEEILLHMRNEANCKHQLLIWGNLSLLWVNVDFLVVAFDMEDRGISHLILDVECLSI